MAIPTINDTYPVAPLENLFNLVGDSAENDIAALDVAPPVATIAALPSTGNYAGRRRVVTATPGATWEYTTAWTMRGVAQFADQTARDAAIPSPGVGMRSKLATELFARRYSSVGNRWIPDWSDGAVLPLMPVASVSGTGTVTVDAEGTITANAAQAIVISNAGDASWDAIEIIWEGAATTPADLLVQQRTAGGVDFVTATHTSLRSTVTPANAFAGFTLTNVAGLVIGRITNVGQGGRGRVVIRDLFKLSPTRISTGSGNDDERYNIASIGGQSPDSTSYPAIKISVPSSTFTGTIRVNVVR